MWSFSVMRMWSQIHAELLSTVMLIINWQEPWTNQHITQFVICLFNLFPGHTEFSFFLFFLVRWPHRDWRYEEQRNQISGKLTNNSQEPTQAALYN